MTDYWVLESMVGERFPAESTFESSSVEVVLPGYTTKSFVVFNVPRHASLASVVLTTSSPPPLGIEFLRSEVRVRF